MDYCCDYSLISLKQIEFYPHEEKRQGTCERTRSKMISESTPKSR